MPTNKNAMTRYKILDDLLSNRYHDYSLDDLTKEVNKRLPKSDKKDGVTRRTIEKDISYLEYEGPFLVDIERYSVPSYNYETQKNYMKRCLRYKYPSFSIFKKDLTDNEEYLLREALSMLGQFDGLPNLEGLEGLRMGLKVKKNTKKIISFTKNPLENSNLLGELFTMISQKQVIELHYQKFLPEAPELVINVHPYLLKEYNRRWYLFAAAEEDDKLLNFSLDRITSVKALTSHEYKEYEGDLNERFEDIIGVTLYDDSPLYKITFWVSDMSKDYVNTKPIHESQKNINQDKKTELRKLYPTLINGEFFQIECKENYELIRELSSFGKNLIVIEPKEIKEKIFSHLSEMYELYLAINK